MSEDHFRSFERRDTSLPAQLMLEDGTSGPVLVQNLSLGGACVELSEAPPRDSTVRLTLDTANSWQPLQIAARVVWVQPKASHFRAGLSFRIEQARTAGGLLDTLTLGAYR
jgi:hypothetical protein